MKVRRRRRPGPWPRPWPRSRAGFAFSLPSGRGSSPLDCWPRWWRGEHHINFRRVPCDIRRSSPCIHEESGMEYRRLGYSGLQVSVIGLGTNNFGPRLDYAAAECVLRQAIEVGINFIETSNTYGEGQAEAFIGKALHGH